MTGVVTWGVDEEEEAIVGVEAAFWQLPARKAKEISDKKNFRFSQLFQPSSFRTLSSLTLQQLSKWTSRSQSNPP